MGHQDYFLVSLPGIIALFISQSESDIVLCHSFTMGKTQDERVPILPSITRKGTTLNTSAALDSPSVLSKLLTRHIHMLHILLLLLNLKILLKILMMLLLCSIRVVH